MECPARIFDRLESEGMDGRPASDITINDDGDSDESTSEVAGSAEAITPVQRRKRSRTEAGFRSDGDADKSDEDERSSMMSPRKS